MQGMLDGPAVENPPVPAPRRAVAWPVTCRRCLAGLVVAVCLLVVVRAFVLEPYQVPTGSMAPTLRGHHRACDCPRCGYPVVVGRLAGDDGEGGPRRYAKAFCPNCGQSAVPVGAAAETAGDQVLVNKTAYLLHAPRRWELVVFRLFGLTFIKRVAGLPGDALAIRDGDVYVGGALARKTFAQARAMAVPVFDLAYAPPGGWRARWDGATGDDLTLDARAEPAVWTCRNSLLDDDKCEPVRDEYAYNGGLHAGREDVHDFLVEADVEVETGQGTLAVALCDGHDWVEVALPVAHAGSAAARTWPAEDDAGDAAADLAADGPAVVLVPRKSHRIAVAFVDRRLSVEVDGRPALAPVDLPPPGPRAGVIRPVRLRADGVLAHVTGVRLFRDVHYSRRGSNGTAGEPVHLGAGQYFVLGDNSPNSEDSRFWPDRGVVPAENLVGRPFLLHLPRRPAAGPWQGQLPDWDRVGWLR
jgi:signal peptidase I